MECPFCEEFVNPSSFKDIVPEWPYPDRIIANNGGAMAFPGLGPIVPKTPYILVVPKRCSTSFLDTDHEDKRSMLDLIDRLVQIDSLFPCGQALVFEHGGITGNSGCKCIDHCHLHLMNIAGPWVRLPEVLSEYHHDGEAVMNAEMSNEKSAYLFAGYYRIGNRSFKGRMARIKGCREPQFFRALIGRMTDNQFDYRRRENVATMIDTYEKAKK